MPQIVLFSKHAMFIVPSLQSPDMASPRGQLQRGGCMKIPYFLAAEATDEFMTWEIPLGKDPVSDYGLSPEDGEFALMRA
jgi:hypothetical protein